MRDSAVTSYPPGEDIEMESRQVSVRAAHPTQLNTVHLVEQP